MKEGETGMNCRTLTTTTDRDGGTVLVLRVLAINRAPAIERKAGPVIGVPARRLPPGKIIASVAYSIFYYLSKVDKRFYFL